MVYSSYVKQRILRYWSEGLRAPSIAKKLLEEEVVVTRVGVHKFIEQYKRTGRISRKPGSGRPSKVTNEIKKIVDDQMENDDETSAVQLHSLLVNKGYKISLATILRCRSSLGWTFRGSAYCQLIRVINKEKRLTWAKENANEEFKDVIFTDECSVQLETHRRFCCRRNGERPKPKPRYIYIIQYY